MGRQNVTASAVCIGRHFSLVSGSSFLSQALPVQVFPSRVSTFPTLSPQGPLNITVQELDGFYTHTVQVEELSSTYELPCHSKIRKCVEREKCACVWSIGSVYGHVTNSCCGPFCLPAGARNVRCHSAVGKRWRWIFLRLSE